MGNEDRSAECTHSNRVGHPERFFFFGPNRRDRAYIKTFLELNNQPLCWPAKLYYCNNCLCFLEQLCELAGTGCRGCEKHVEGNKKFLRNSQVLCADRSQAVVLRQ